MVTKYIKFKGSMRPKGLTLATDSKLKQLKNSGFRQGKDMKLFQKKLHCKRKEEEKLKNELRRIIKISQIK